MVKVTREGTHTCIQALFPGEGNTGVGARLRLATGSSKGRKRHHCCWAEGIKSSHLGMEFRDY